MRKNNVFAIIAIVAFALAGLSGCGKKQVSPAQLENNYWILTGLNGNVARNLFDGPIPSLEFNFGDSIISGSSGCNRYFGKFILNKNNFSAPNLAGTMMACAFVNAETEFLAALSADKIQLAIESDSILSFRRENTEILRFVRGTESDRNNNVMNMNRGERETGGLLPVPVQPEDKTRVVENEEFPVRRKTDIGNKKATSEYMRGVWVLKGIANENVYEIFGERRPTIDFKQDGTLTGNAGCNNYRSTYKMNDHILTVSEIASTRMTCPEIEGETRFINFMSEPVEAYMNMEDTALLLFKGDDLVLEFVRE